MTKKPKLKLVDKYFDERYQATTYFYEYPNGVRLVHTYKPGSINFECSIITRGGGFYEPQLQLPGGTFHFYEHIAAGNPNKVFKTRQARDTYTYGNRRRPGLSVNASTGTRFLYFYGSSHISGAERLLQFLDAEIDYPLNQIDTYIEKERQIILSEEANKPKLTEDSDHQYDQLMVGGVYPELLNRVIGTAETIKQISTADLEVAARIIKHPGNAVIAIQDGNPELTNTAKAIIDQIADRFVADSVPRLEKVGFREMPNELRLGHFGEEKMQDTHTAFHFLSPYPVYRHNYEEFALQYMTRNLLSKVGFDKLREEKNLIYAFETFRFWPANTHLAEGFKLRCPDELLPKVLQELEALFTDYIPAFLATREAELWVNDLISRYIYPSTPSYDKDYAEGYALDFMESNDFKYDYQKAAKASREITLTDLQNRINDFYRATPPRIWIVDQHKQNSPSQEALKNSAIYQHYTRL